MITPAAPTGQHSTSRCPKLFGKTGRKILSRLGVQMLLLTFSQQTEGKKRLSYLMGKDMCVNLSTVTEALVTEIKNTNNPSQPSNSL